MHRTQGNRYPVNQVAGCTGVANPIYQKNGNNDNRDFWIICIFLKKIKKESFGNKQFDF
jgi:hypothetical protein